MNSIKFYRIFFSLFCLTLMLAQSVGNIKAAHTCQTETDFPADEKPNLPMNDETKVSYKIKIKGHIDKQWSEWLGDLEISYDDQGNTLLSGSIVDQAALHGILAQIRDLGLTIISLTSQI